MSTSDRKSNSRKFSEVIEDEKLFEEYLAARAKEAATKMQAALRNRAEDPTGAAKAKRAASQAQAALASQRQRVIEAEQAISKIRAKGGNHRALGTLKPRRHQLSAKPQGLAKTSKLKTGPRKPLAAAGTQRAAKKPTAETENKQPQMRRRGQGSRKRKKSPKTGQPASAHGLVGAKAIPTLECGLCSARVPSSASQCSCGWHVPQRATKLPRVTLSAAERTAIASGLNIARPAKKC